jgi:hypothetical protein
MNLKSSIFLFLVLLAYSCNSSNNKSNQDSTALDSNTIASGPPKPIAPGPPKPVAPPKMIDACQYIQDLKVDYYKDGPSDALFKRVSVLANKSNITPRFYGGTAGLMYPKDSFELDMRIYENYFKCK